MAKKTFEQKSAEVLKSMEQDRQMLLDKQPFIGGFLLNLELVPMPGELVKTACTDGKRIMMGIPFYAKLNKAERLFVMAHEAWHCVLMHGLRCQTRNHELFNIAADLEIHFILQKEEMQEPFVLPHDPAWNGLSAEEIYERLPKFLIKVQKGSKDENGIGIGLGGGKDKKEQEPKDGIGSGLGGKESEHIHGQDGGGFDRHIYPGENNPGMGNHSWDPMEGERIRRLIIQTAQLYERRQGSLPGHIQGIVEKLRKPELPWQELLRQFVTSCYGGSRRWLPPERRHISRGLYLPSYRDYQMNAVLAIDTSGSTTGDLPQFFIELSSLLNSFGNYELTVIQCDDVIQHVETFSDAKRLPNKYQWKSFGHGGTSFIPPFEYIREKRLKPEIFIYLTDGFGDAPETAPKFPVLWVLTHDGQKPALWGRCIKLKENQDNTI